MKITAQCKFCKKPITLTIDDAYSELGDPYKLLPLAACNRCADLKELQWRTKDRLVNVAGDIIADKKQKDYKRLRDRLELNLKEYLRYVCGWIQIPLLPYDESLTDEAMAHPKEISKVIDRIWLACRQSKPQPELSVDVPPSQS